MSAPAPLTVNIPDANEEVPGTPTLPTSVLTQGAGKAGGGLPPAVMVATALDESVAPALSVIVKVKLNVPALMKVCDAVGDDEFVTLVPPPTPTCTW